MVSVKGSASHRGRSYLAQTRGKPSRRLWHARARAELAFPGANDAAPPLHAASSSADFLQIIGSFHQRGYTVQNPDVAGLGPELQRLCARSKMVLRQRIKAAVFWSAAGAKAMIHYDKPHNIIIHLAGRKHSSSGPTHQDCRTSGRRPGNTPNLQNHQVLDVEPGNLIYIPGWRAHTVESTTKSLHLAIVFEPITLREAIIAAVDFLSDSERELREAIAGRASDVDPARLSALVAAGLNRLRDHIRSPHFVSAAMDLRASRATADLPPLGKPATVGSVTRDSRVRRSPLAISHLRHSAGSLDFSQPGEHIAVHRGMEPELRFIAQLRRSGLPICPARRARRWKIALVTRLLQSGLRSFRMRSPRSARDASVHRAFQSFARTELIRLNRLDGVGQGIVLWLRRGGGGEQRQVVEARGRSRRWLAARLKLGEDRLARATTAAVIRRAWPPRCRSCGRRLRGDFVEEARDRRSIRAPGHVEREGSAGPPSRVSS